MANLTLAIDDKLLQAARIRAVREGTSVNEVCRKAIEGYAKPAGQALLAEYQALVAQIEANRSNEPPRPVPWRSRAEMYDRILEERHPTLMKSLKSRGR